MEKIRLVCFVVFFKGWSNDRNDLGDRENGNIGGECF
jgi:hypothetical protein